MSISYYQQGQTLIEALSALAIIAIILSAITVAVMTSLNNATYDQDQTLAAKYAEEGSEIVHAIRDDDYAAFQGFGGTYCLAKGQTTLGAVKGSCPTANVDNFVRSVQIQKNGCAANIAKVSVSVSFKDGKCTSNTFCHTITTDFCLSTVNPVQAP